MGQGQICPAQGSGLEPDKRRLKRDTVSDSPQSRGQPALASYKAFASRPFSAAGWSNLAHHMGMPLDAVPHGCTIGVAARAQRGLQGAAPESDQAIRPCTYTCMYCIARHPTLACGRVRVNIGFSTVRDNQTVRRGTGWRYQR